VAQFGPELSDSGLQPITAKPLNKLQTLNLKQTPNTEHRMMNDEVGWKREQLSAVSRQGGVSCESESEDR
jgi:hypothetical protein